MIPQTKFFSLLNKTFLSEIIGEPVREFALSTGSSQGDNIASSLIAVDIKTNSGKIHHIVIKTPPLDDPGQRTYVKKWRIFEVENQFYSVIVPQLESLLNRSNNKNNKNQNKKDKQKSLGIPKYFFGSSEIIALADLRPLGFKMADKFTGLNLAEMKLAMEKLGQFHALTYTFIRENGESFFTAGQNGGDNLNSLFLNCITFNKLDPDPKMHALGKETFRKIYERNSHILADQNPDLSRKMLRLAPFAEKLMLEPYNKTDVKYFPVISHGDFWLNNLLFRYDSSATGDFKNREKPLEVVFLDFQQTRRDSIFYDLLYFIFTSTTPEFRKQNLLQILNVYFDGFVGILRDLEKPLPLNFTRGWLVDEFYENLPSVFAYLLFAIPLQLGDFSKLGLKSPQSVEELTDDNLMSIPDMTKRLSETTAFLLEFSPAALDRLEAVANEMDELGIFDRQFLNIL